MSWWTSPISAYPAPKTFFNGKYVGETLTERRMAGEDVLIGDELVARLRVYTHPAVKSNHSDPNLSDSHSWAWNAYITSVGFDAVGHSAGVPVAPVNAVAHTHAAQVTVADRVQLRGIGGVGCG